MEIRSRLRRMLSKLELGQSRETARKILDAYSEKGYCTVHFLYFANIVLNGLEKEGPGKEEGLEQALLSGDFLLPDGIALRLLYGKHFGKELPNLNGTDFLPYFLGNLPKNTKAEILLYGTSPETISETARRIAGTFGFPIISVQHGFQEFDWSWIAPKEDGTVRILLIGRGSPLQEIWTQRNSGKIREARCLAFTVGGLLDFWAGAEKRAPLWIRRCKMEWLYRALSDPKKNLRKTLVSLRLLQFLIP